MIWTKAFWQGLGERAIKTFFQALLAAAGVGVVGNTTGITDVEWLQVLSIAALATVLSIATSIANADFTAGANLPPQPTQLPYPAPTDPATVSEAYQPPTSGVPPGYSQ